MTGSINSAAANLGDLVKRVKPADLLVLLALLFTTIQTARLFWTLVTPVAPIGDWKPQPVQVVPMAERAALFGSFDPFFRTTTATTESDVVTSLPLTLFGIRTNEASGGGSAIIGGADGTQMSWSVGETIMSGVTLHAVAFDHVVLSNNGVLEKLFIDQSVPVENVTPAGVQPTPEVSAAAAPSAKLDVASLQQSINLAPRNEGGKVSGLIVSAKDDGTMMSAAGLQKGDIIVSMNGRPLTNAAELTASLRPGARLSLEVERGGQKVPVALILEQ